MVDVVSTMCPHCGEVDVPIKDVVLSVITETEGGHGFRCPECRDGVWKEDERRRCGRPALSVRRRGHPDNRPGYLIPRSER